MRYLTFETDLFFSDIPDDQLDQWFVGADCAGWFYARLLPFPGIRPRLDPTMEDWGWIMAVETHGIVVEICVWEYLDQRMHWLLGVAGKKKFLKKTDPDLIRAAEQSVEVSLNTVIEADSRFSKVKWHDDNPMDHQPSQPKSE
ncbi:MAG: hypothetical protein JJU29_20965 [Verrucomicrobia bacterium]|nr:hypothetical protein [Verrucomicrobiota bacterium]MCH8513735.1 hypothetical protein [Kiritimatiellia bacterium]